MMKKIGVMHKNLNRFLAQKKLLFLLVFVLMLLVLSPLAVAVDNVTSGNFWCSVEKGVFS